MSQSLRAYQHDVHSEHSGSHHSDCEKCRCCSVSFPKEKCSTDIKCSLAVDAKAKVANIGCIKIYMFDIILKNCTKDILPFVSASLEIGASSLLITSACSSPVGNCAQVTLASRLFF